MANTWDLARNKTMVKEGNIPQGWGNITGEEMVRRFWEGTVQGGYVGHGDTFLYADGSGCPRSSIKR